jgi:hypothetical protein
VSSSTIARPTITKAICASVCANFATATEATTDIVGARPFSRRVRTNSPPIVAVGVT